MPDFIYCLNSSTIRPTPILEKIAVAADAGYAAIELWHDDIDRNLQSGGTLRELRRAIDDSGLEVPTTIMLKGWCTEGAEYRAGIEECKRRMEQAQAVGATYAIAGPPHGMVDRPLAAKRYRELLEIGEPFGVRPAMEYLGFVQDINRIEDALQIMEESEHPAATIVLDPFHCHRGPGTMESISKLTSDRIAISHFNDAPAHPPASEQHDPDRVLPGEGILDLRRYVELLRQVGYNRWLSLELFREDLWSRDPREVARLGLEKMRAVVEG